MFILYIGAGSLAVDSFKQVLGVFAAILLYSSYKILFQGEDDEEEVRDYLLKFTSYYTIHLPLFSLYFTSNIRRNFPLISPYFNLYIGYSGQCDCEVQQAVFEHY